MSSMWTDEDPFLVVHSDGSLGSAGWEAVFGPNAPTQASADLDIEELIDMELEADRPPKRPAQKTLDEVLRPKPKAKAKIQNQHGFDFQKALKGASASGRGHKTRPGPESFQWCATSEGDEAGGLGKESSSSSASASTSGVGPRTTVEGCRRPAMSFTNTRPCDDPQP